MSRIEDYGCKMSISQHGKTFTWETDAWDCDMEDFLEAFYGMMIGATYHPETVLRSMKEFAEERLECWEKDDDADEHDGVPDDDPSIPIDVRSTCDVGITPSHF